MYIRSPEEFFTFLHRKKGHKLDHDLATLLAAATSRWRAMSLDLAFSPLFSSIVSFAATLYASKRLPLKTDTLVIFTCGASADTSKSAREQLLQYADKYFQHGTFFRAEDAFPVLLKSGKDDLLTIEHKLADYSDCVVIINESAGTLAELGAFASNEKVVKKLLVVNPQEHAGSESFVNLGPIAKANKKSLFGEVIHYDPALVSIYFDAVLARIEKHALKKYRSSVDFSAPDTWRTSEGKLRLLFLQDILNLFSPITRNELLSVMKKVVPYQYVKYDIELGMLIATKKVMEYGDTLMTAQSCGNHSYSVSSREWLKIRKRILDLYRAKDKPRLIYLHRRSAGLS